MTPESSRFVRFALALGVLGGTAFALVLGIYSGIPSVLHGIFVVGTTVAALVFFRADPTRVRLRLGMALVVGSGISWFVHTTLATSLLVHPWHGFTGGVVAVPLLVLAPLQGRRHLATRLVAAWLVAAFAMLLTSGVVTFRKVYSYTEADVAESIRRAEAQPGVTVPFRAGTHHLFDPRSILVEGDRVLAAFSDSSGLGGMQGVAELPGGALLALPAMDALMRDPVTDRLFGIASVNSNGDRLVWIDEGESAGARDGSAQVQSLVLPQSSALAGHLDVERRRMLVVHEEGALTVVALDPPRVAEERDLSLYHPDEAVWIEELDHLFVRSSDGWIAALDLDDLSIERRYLGPSSAGMGLGVSASRRELYAAEIASGTVHVLDAETLEKRARWKLDPGLRPIVALDPEPWVALVSYFDGSLTLVEADGGAVLGRFFVGDLGRDIRWDPEERVLWVATSLGVVRVEVDVLRSSAGWRSVLGG